jgi:CheY-like chemotaxis protein
VKPTTGWLKVVDPSQPATPEPRVTGSASVAEPEDDDVVSLRSQALRTPLDSMVVFADLVASDDVTEEQRQLYAGRLRRESRRLTGLIERGLTKSDYVLIVDGDAAFARLLKTELAAVGLETLRASDAETAAQLLAGTSPRAVILDLRFAGLPGTEFLARMRPDRSTQVPIVMLAAEDVLAAEMSALEEEWDVEVLPKEAGAPQAAAALISEALTA